MNYLVFGVLDEDLIVIRKNLDKEITGTVRMHKKLPAIAKRFKQGGTK